jgi:exonuclease I
MPSGYCPICMASLEDAWLDEEDKELVVCDVCGEAFPEFLAMDAEEVKEERATRKGEMDRDEW